MEYDRELMINKLVKSLLHNTTEAMFIKNKDLVYIGCSEAFARDVAGKNSVSDIIGKTELEIFSDEKIAKKYRADDMMMIETNTKYIQFREEYPGIKGRKRYCQTTKYLLTDEDGIAFGIFGQCYDITKLIELEKLNDDNMNTKIVKALNSIYFSSNIFSIKNNNFYSLTNTDYSEKMLNNCNSAKDAFKAFIRTLVQDDYAEKMTEFCDISTLEKRLMYKSHIDCEYKSKVAKGYCQASFLPVEYDEDGHLNYGLFLVSSVDLNKVKEIEEGISNKRSLQTMFSEIPGGLVLYEWNGEKLITLRISDYYNRIYGYSLSKDGGPDFARVHPLDVDNYKKAIIEAITTTHHLEYVYRVWDNESNRYLWTKINAVSRPQPDGTSLIYAMYSDITKQKDIEEKLENSQNTSKYMFNKQLVSLLNMNDDALCMCLINITKNSFSYVNAKGVIKEAISKSKTLSKLVGYASKNITDPAKYKEYTKLFDLQNLLNLYNKGDTHVQIEHFYKTSDGHIVWVETAVDMIYNPITKDVEGIAYARNVNKEYISNMLLSNALENDYLVTSVVYKDSGEYYLYSTSNNIYCEYKTDFWHNLINNIKFLCEANEAKELVNSLDKDNILNSLDKYGEYSATFYGEYHKEACRMEAKFIYADKDHKLIISSIRNITDKALLLKYKHDSEHDALTGLFNRKTLFNKCRILLDENPNENFTIFHFDLKHFHLYNTFYGESEGDKLLCFIAGILKEFTKNRNKVCYGRIEADVFCLFMAVDEANFEVNILNEFAKIKEYRSDFLLEPVAGYFVITDKSMPVQSMFARATIAAKSNNNNIFGLISKFSEEMEQSIYDKQAVINEMQHAIDNEEFKVYLQPKYCLRNNNLVGAEALVRWAHPTKGIISPAKFIPVFESNGFIAELDKYMWKHVCILLQNWKHEGRPLLPVSVNMSRVSMYSPNTVSYIKSLVDEYQIDPKLFEIELTETAYMDDPEEMKKQLKELQEYGFNILMDDFGSGYSSLNTLKEVPVNCIKLDMKFLSSTNADEKGRLVLSSVVRMGKLLGLSVIAEGVETDTQAAYLCSIGCEYAQGFLFAHPMPVEEYEKLLTQDIIDSKCDNDEYKQGIQTLLSDNSFSFFNLLPIPIALIEYNGKKAIVLRCNMLFIEEFGLNKDYKPASKIFISHLSKEDLSNLKNAFEVSTKEKQNSKCTIEFNKGQFYIVNISYQGIIGENSVLLATLTRK